VIGLERFELGHARGASEDHSRIIRRSYSSADYVRFTQHAFETWAEVAEESGEELVTITGGLDLFPRDPIDEPAPFLHAMREEGVEHEVLDAAALVARWPVWHVSDAVVAIYQHDAGIVAASRANAVHRRLARARGADLLPETPVEEVSPDRDGFALETATRTYRCGSLVIAADAWMNEVLAPLGVRLPLRILQEQVTYFDATDPASFDPATFPVWIWHSDPHMYGLPSFGRPGPKVAIHGGGPEVTPETRTFQPDPGYAAVVERFIREHLPGAVGPPLEVRTCLYTLTPDQDFVLDLVPGTSNASFGLGTAHGFKFASVFGRTLVELALDGISEWRLPRFAADRPSLTQQA